MEKKIEMATPTVEQLQAEIEELKNLDDTLRQQTNYFYDRTKELEKKLIALKDIVEVIVGNIGK